MDFWGSFRKCRVKYSFGCVLKIPLEDLKSDLDTRYILNVPLYDVDCGLIAILSSTSSIIAAMGVMVHLQHAAPSASHLAIGAAILGVIVLVADYARMLYLRSKMVCQTWAYYSVSSLTLHSPLVLFLGRLSATHINFQTRSHGSISRNLPSSTRLP